MPTAPVRVPGRTPARGGPHRSSFGAADDISHLTLTEVRERLARNERVLQSALFSTSPSAPTSPLIVGSPNGAGFGFGGGAATSPGGVGIGIPGASRPSAQGPAPGAPGGAGAASVGFAPGTSPVTAYYATRGAAEGDDPVRERLLAVRQQLRAREAELLAESLGGISLENSSAAFATSPTSRSGKARALDQIQRTEAGKTRPAMSLPISQTLALGERDFDNQTAARMAGLNMSASSSQPRRIDDELGRAADAAVYARLRVDADDDDVFDTDEQYAAASVFASMRHDTGNGLPMASKKAREQEGFDNDMLGEDEPGDSNFAEGDDEYDGAGHGSMESGPSMGGEFDEQMHD